MEALGPDGPASLTLPGGTSAGDVAVGDWVTHDPTTGRMIRVLDRTTLLQRRTAGTGVDQQLIAANVDTLGIVSSCNADFNAARLERYLVLASTAGCLPLVILTKADEADDPDSYRRHAEALSPLVAALTLDARNPEEIDRLRPWCGPGQTLALVGSSGVGKTTLTNALTGRREATQDIRADDAKGRHTTTARALWRTTAGGWLIDTPGMRALRLNDAADGIDAVFSDVSDLAMQCRFSNCHHTGEPGCAIEAAIEAGTLDRARVDRWEKLLIEDARNTATIAQSRARDKAFGKMVKDGQSRGRHKRDL